MRRTGVLLHITSLPSPYGIGTIGQDAKDFVKFIKESGQTYWEVLPINPTGYGDSPYSSMSAFASNPYLIDLDLLIQDGLLTQNEIYENINYQIDDRVNYGGIYETRFKILRIAYNRFNKNDEFKKFKKENKWLDGYASYMTLKNLFNGLPWFSWDNEYRNYKSKEVKKLVKEHLDDYDFWCFTQFIFDKQFLDLRKYANDLGIKLIGDIPINVSYDSSDVWSNPQYFDLDKDYVPRKVSGVPPDEFSETGQLWGNPLYLFKVMKEDGYSWWVERFKQTFRYFDYVRIDHFRGFEAYWAIPYGDETAVNGKWIKGPGYDLFKTINEKIPNALIIAEDLGYITPGVKRLLKRCGYPGMRILEFAFDPHGDSNYAPHNLVPNAVCYPGTHDNQTIKQWFKETDKETHDYTYEYLSIHHEGEEVYRFIACCLASVCEFSIVNIVDYLELGSEGRMNTPNTREGNWTFRLRKDQLSQFLKDRMLFMAKLYRRIDLDEEK